VRTSSQGRIRIQGQWLIFGFIILTLFGLEVFGVYKSYSSQFHGAADFHSRWYGARELLLEGRDPYSPEVTAELEAIRDPNQRDYNSHSFAYPLYVIFVFLPLAFLDYGWTQAFWMVTLQWVTIAIAAGVFVFLEWRPSPVVTLGIILALLLFYPVARTILLGQFTLHVTLFLLFSLISLKRGLDGWAGIWLAAATIKPQTIALVVVWMVIWALWQRRWRFLAGLAGGGVALLAASMMLLPQWPLSFLRDLQGYASLASGRYPLEVLLEVIWPEPPRVALLILSGALVGVMIWVWIRAIRSGDQAGDQDSFFRATFMTVAVGALVLFQTGSTNQVLLVIPLLVWLWQMSGRKGTWAALAVTLLFLAVPWFLFLRTISGNYESPVLLLPLPLFCLVVLLLSELRSRQPMLEPG
jgi:xanthosine utilization system XapX-like protein